MTMNNNEQKVYDWTLEGQDSTEGQEQHLFGFVNGQDQVWEGGFTSPLFDMKCGSPSQDFMGNNMDMDLTEALAAQFENMGGGMARFQDYNYNDNHNMFFIPEMPVSPTRRHSIACDPQVARLDLMSSWDQLVPPKKQKLVFVDESAKFNWEGQGKQHRKSAGNTLPVVAPSQEPQFSLNMLGAFAYSAALPTVTEEQIGEYAGRLRDLRRYSAPAATHLTYCPWPGCNKAFTRLYNVNSHYRTHTKERPFGCGVCGQLFARGHDLKRHWKIHSADKPFACDGCGKSFSRSDALTRHRTSVGGCARRKTSCRSIESIDESG